jgi:hypothetical protein
MRKQIGEAKDDPLQFALKAVVDSITYQDESLYLMSLISKYMKQFIQLVTLLASNGEDILIEDLKARTLQLAVDIERLKARVDPSKLSQDQLRIISEVTRLLKKGG